MGIRAGRRLLVARALRPPVVAGGLIGLSAGSASASDDYPWAWQGQCPIVPQEPIVEPTADPDADARRPDTRTPGEARRRPRPPVEPPSAPSSPAAGVRPGHGHTRTTRAGRARRARAGSGRSTARSATRGASCCATARASSPGGCGSATGWRLQQPLRRRALGRRARLGRRRPRAGLPGRLRPGDRRRSPSPTTVASGTSPGSRAIGPGTVTIEEYNHADAGRLRHPHRSGRRLPLPPPRRRGALAADRLGPPGRVGRRRAR